MSAPVEHSLADLRGAVRRALLLRQADNIRARDGARRLMREDVADAARLEEVLRRLDAEIAAGPKVSALGLEA